MAQVSDVESILNKLNKLEEEIERLNSSIEDIRKRLLLLAEEEKEELKEKIVSIAKGEADKIVNKARREAEAEANKITVEAERNLAIIQNNVKKAFDDAVELALKKIIG
ncbi:MAG: hypothetical protein D6752_01100 [Candidatus Nitrosothermus koennekii]|nr:MAG: hypothetical protein D6752_01100 [Candidatus Nitrosothermus koennekii]